jgi:lipid-A-disaccharide synthase
MDDAPPKIMLVAVEASADALGAGLARALKTRLGDGVRLVGVGGAQMAAEGVESPFDISDLSLVGLFEIVGAIPRALGCIAQTVRLARNEQPDAIVLIDSWEFTWRVARRLRRLMPDALMIKYVAPQVWATRPGRARAAARLFDRMMTLFPFEPAYFETEGLASTCVGAPTFSLDFSRADPARLRAKIGAAPSAPILLVLPGSRPSEIERVGPAFEDAAMRLKDERPDLEIVVAAAPTIADKVKAFVASWRHRAHVVEGEPPKLDAMRAATLALAKSGTVTSELAAAGCPMIVGYRAHPATALVARALLRTPYLTLLNIAAQAEVAPEFLQEECTGASLAAAAARLLDVAQLRQAQVAAQWAALAKLASPIADPYDAAAETVLQTIAARWPGKIPAQAL